MVVLTDTSTNILETVEITDTVVIEEEEVDTSSMRKGGTGEIGTTIYKVCAQIGHANENMNKN